MDEKQDSGRAVDRTVVLIRRSQAGDRAAFEELFARYWERVFAIVRQRMGPGLRRMLDVEDVVQSTFEAAVKGFERFELRHEAAFIQWLAKLAERQVQTALRHAQAQKRDRRREVGMDRGRSDGWGSSLSWDVVAGGIAIPEQIAQRELVAIVEQCLDELPEDWREVILLRDFASGSWEFVAGEMGRASIEAAQELHRRARIRLSTLLGKKLADRE
jgi:RNA polymerase sigma-70 factor (ECF subfamily)